MTEPRAIDSLSRFVWCISALWFCAFLIHFSILTEPIRFANSDDALYQRVVDAQKSWDHSMRVGRQQARFYMPVAYGPIASLYSVRNPTLFSAIRASLLGLELLSGALLIAALTRSRGFALGVTLIFALTLPINLPFNLLLSYPQIGLGFVLFTLTGAAALQERQSWLTCVVSAAGTLAACSVNEVFLVPTLLGTALLLRNDRRVRPATAGIALAVFGYLLVYFIFRYAHPSMYGGTEFSLNPAEYVHTLLCQIAGTLPGFELAVHRYGFDGGATWKSPGQIAHLLTNISVTDLTLLVSGTALLLAILPQIQPVPRTLGVAAGSVLLAVSFLLPLAGTIKYQIWTHLRQFPYAYALYTSYFLLIGGFLLWNRARERLNPGRPRQLVTTALVLVIALASWAASASNENVLRALTCGPYPLSGDSVRKIDAP